ncbi:hypothetical protein J1N35_043294 [Gossypium stocksii]|uniref:Cytochrome P450 n=1 Tax=Gossypium stocksii TaxID=47602 RepID=A0A9D3U707_9ROSI|nr:hypothetical protein J1N35_043294 [Gossypium stocksii]
MTINPNTNLYSSDNDDSFAGICVSRWLFFLHLHIVELILALIVFIAIHYLRQKRRYGLPVWPVLGMLPTLISGLRSDLFELITHLVCQQNGTFLFIGPWFSSLSFVVTADPRNLEHVLKTKFSVYRKGPPFRENVGDLLGDGIFSADDETWRRQRKAASIEFHSAKFRRLTTESLEELVHARLLSVLENATNKSIPIELQDILLRLTFDNVCIIALGIDPGCLIPELPNIPFAKAFEDATEVTMLRFVTPTWVWKTMKCLDLGSEKKLKKLIKEVDEFVKKVTETRKKELSVSLRQRSDLLTVFMTSKDEEGKPFSDKFLRDICVNFILAGRDTSAVALSWFFWLVGKNPRVEEKIVAEISGIVKEREEIKNGELIFKAEEIKKMDYLQAALSEALRLYPSVPVDMKEAAEDDVLPDGTVIKTGTKVVYAIYTMGRIESIWGKDCREYKPKRWLRDGNYMSESAYKFSAFNGGPRLCLGKYFAFYQIKFTAASILYRYTVKVVKGHPVAPKIALTMYMKYELMVNLINRHELGLYENLK